jgi:hypothetical protein
MSIKNSNDTTGNLIRELSACSAVLQTSYPNLCTFETITVGGTLLNEQC